MVVITNKEIYDKLLEIERHVIKTNGKVKLNRWIAGVSFGLCITIIFALANIRG